MSTLVTNEGSYRVKIVESAVGITTTGLPQFIFSAKAIEWYDADTGEWMPWEEYDEGITGYMCLFGKDGQPLKNAEQIMKIFGWDGMSFDDLDDADYSDIVFQIRVADEEYDGKTRRKVQWIDIADATPGGSLGTVEKLDSAKRSALNKQFAKQLKALSGGKVKTAKAPADKPAPAPKDEAKKSAPPKRPPAPPKKEKKSKVTVEYDYQSAWDAVESSAPENVNDDTIVQEWYKAIDEHAKDKKEDEITSDEWAKIVASTKKALK